MPKWRVLPTSLFVNRDTRLTFVIQRRMTYLTGIEQSALKVDKDSPKRQNCKPLKIVRMNVLIIRLTPLPRSQVKK
jgi:hypothetical protein